MLPASLTSPASLAKLGITSALVLGLATAPAMAWGKKEQGFLTGVAATLLMEAVLNPQMFQGAKPAPAPQPVYYTPPTTSIYQTPTAAAFNSYSSNERRRIQSTLSAYGYYHSTIDGDFGPNTYNAIAAYAGKKGKSDLMATQAGAYSLLDSLLF